MAKFRYFFYVKNCLDFSEETFSFQFVKMSPIFVSSSFFHFKKYQNCLLYSLYSSTEVILLPIDEACTRFVAPPIFVVAVFVKLPAH